MDRIEKDNETLIAFWNQELTLTEESKEELKQFNDSDWKQIVPSGKLFDAVKGLANKKKILDYGCGSGWASIVASRSGANDVTAVDVVKDGIDAVKLYADAFKANFKTLYIEPDWLSKQPSETYDGIVCSNVLDVIPLETSKEIIKELARVATPDADIIIGLNFYFDEEIAKKHDMHFEDGHRLYIKGILRLVNLTDQEWKDLVSPYFNIVKFEYFAWHGELKETRRLFYLKKK